MDFLVTHLTNRVLDTLTSSNPHDLINKLQERYEKRNAVAIVAARTKLTNIKLANYNTTEDYCDTITSLVGQPPYYRSR